MKKLLFVVLFLLIVTMGSAQTAELTADTPAVEPTILSQILQALWAGLAVMLGFLVKQAIPLLNAYLKELMHFRGAAVVADALTQALGELSVEAQKALTDGKIDKTEWATLKARANSIAKDRLKALSGFYKADLNKWVDDQLDVLLGKLLSRI